jgi:hypothetical protein
MTDPVRGRHIDLRSPRGYYIDWSSLADRPSPIAGAAAGRRGARRPPAPSPSDVARWALGNLEHYLESGSAERTRFFRDAARFLSASIEVVPGSFGGWAMPDLPAAYAADLRSGWFSGAAQGECLSVLARAALLLGMDDALDTARRAYGGFEAPVSEGGFLRELGDAGPSGPAFLEEYPVEGRPVMRLSGHVRALWGVYDYWKASGEDAAGSLFDRCVRGLSFVLDRFDMGYWTRRDLDQGEGGSGAASLVELREHILQMSVMYEITGVALFADTAGRWRGYAESPVARARVLLSRAAP